jgi:AcrR family transcriptional regulator
MEEETPGGKTVTLRRKPVQQRAQKTVNLILDAATALLAEEGIDGFNTNAIADRAGINISTLYGYFTDKYTILWAMVERVEASRMEFLAERFALLPDAQDPVCWLHGTIDRLVEFRQQTPGSIQLRRAMATMPEFGSYHLDREEQSAELLADALQRRCRGVGPVTARRMSRVLTKSATRLLDDACRDGTVDVELVKGYKEMAAAWISANLR